MDFEKLNSVSRLGKDEPAAVESGRQLLAGCRARGRIHAVGSKSVEECDVASPGRKPGPFPAHCKTCRDINLTFDA